ncbi:hypothetical protein PM082_000389 [Marasmius tenuissimus]|nr:hypothetical protein PM082_000389 [Marasmius tenuissimus]
MYGDTETGQAVLVCTWLTTLLAFVNLVSISAWFDFCILRLAEKTFPDSLERRALSSPDHGITPINSYQRTVQPSKVKYNCLLALRSAEAHRWNIIQRNTRGLQDGSVVARGSGIRRSPPG